MLSAIAITQVRKVSGAAERHAQYGEEVAEFAAVACHLSRAPRYEEALRTPNRCRRSSS